MYECLPGAEDDGVDKVGYVANHDFSESLNRSYRFVRRVRLRLGVQDNTSLWEIWDTTHQGRITVTMLEPGGRVVGQLEGPRLLSSFTVPSVRRRARISGVGKTSRCLATHALRKDSIHQASQVCSQLTLEFGASDLG